MDVGAADVEEVEIGTIEGLNKRTFKLKKVRPLQLLRKGRMSKKQQIRDKLRQPFQIRPLRWMSARSEGLKQERESVLSELKGKGKIGLSRDERT